MNNDWKRYRRKGDSEMRPWCPGDDMTRVSVSPADKENGSPKPGDMIARNPKNHADQWLVAKAYFEENLLECEGAPEDLTPRTSGLSFGAALEYLKSGMRITRAGWNGRGMYLWLLPAATVKAEWCREPHLNELARENGGEIECLGSIRMFTVNASGRRAVLTGWLASQSDMLSEDWQILD